MSKRKYTYHVICDCFYVSKSGNHLPIGRIGDIDVSYNGNIDSDCSMKDTSVVLEYCMCRDKRLNKAILPFMRNRLLFRLRFISHIRNSPRVSYTTWFAYRYISD